MAKLRGRAPGSRGGYSSFYRSPASTGSRAPETPDERSEARKRAARATSSSVTSRPSAVPAAACRSASSDGQPALCLAAGEALAKRVGGDGAWADGVDADPAAGRGRAPPCERARAPRASRPCTRPGPEQHGPSSSTPSPRSRRRPAQRAGAVLQRRRDAADVHRERPVERLEVELGRLAPRRDDAGVGDDDVEAAEPARPSPPRPARRRPRRSRRRRARSIPPGTGPARGRRRRRLRPRPRTCRAIAAPRPRVPPVTSATRPSSRPGNEPRHARGASGGRLGSGLGCSPACACVRATSSPSTSGSFERRVAELVDDLVVRRRPHDLGVAVGLVDDLGEHVDPVVDVLLRPHLAGLGRERLAARSTARG